MKLLIIGGIHHKNKIGICMICNYLNIEYKFSNIFETGFDLIYSPSRPIKSNIPTIYGPHFPNVYPTCTVAKSLKSGIYIQPSQWVISNVWPDFNNIPIVPFPFPVDTEKFKSKDCEKSEVFIYYKSRIPKELNFVIYFLKSKKTRFKIFKYGSYNEEDYLNTLQKAKYGVWVGRHESQGFALEEALSCNIPLIVWNVKSMNQEFSLSYPDIKATTIPYWDERCGEYFYEKEELDSKFNTFISKLDSYKPRDYIIENLSVKKCSERFLDLINKYDLK